MNYNSWELTLDQIMEMSESVGLNSVVTIEGHLLLSRDRKIESPRRAKEMYQQSLILALQKEKSIPRRVLLANLELVEKVKGEVFVKQLLAQKPEETAPAVNSSCDDEPAAPAATRAREETAATSVPTHEAEPRVAMNAGAESTTEFFAF